MEVAPEAAEAEDALEEAAQAENGNALHHVSKAYQKIG